jgi:hypothetical protein
VPRRASKPAGRLGLCLPRSSVLEPP